MQMVRWSWKKDITLSADLLDLLQQQQQHSSNQSAIADNRVSNNKKTKHQMATN